MAFIPCQTHYTSLTKTASAEHVVQFRPPHLFGHLQKLGYSLCKTITGTFDDLGSILSGMEASFARQNLSILSIPCCTATDNTSLRLGGRGKPVQSTLKTRTRSDDSNRSEFPRSNKSARSGSGA